MSAYFLDSSALVKYYVLEPGSIGVRQIVDDAESILIVANISLAEVAAALSQMQRDGPFGKTFVRKTILELESALRQQKFVSHQVDAETIELAVKLVQRQPLKGYDAIQAASAMLTQRKAEVNITFVSGDRQLLRAVAAEGIEISNPG